MISHDVSESATIKNIDNETAPQEWKSVFCLTEGGRAVHKSSFENNYMVVYI